MSTNRRTQHGYRQRQAKQTWAHVHVSVRKCSAVFSWWKSRMKVKVSSQNPLSGKKGTIFKCSSCSAQFPGVYVMLHRGKHGPVQIIFISKWAFLKMVHKLWVYGIYKAF